MNSMGSMYKVLMFGGREWSGHKPVDREMRGLIKKHGRDKLLIIVGGASGADIIAEISAHVHSVHTARVDALWATRHKAAGPQRNSVMVALEPDEAICFHEDIKNSVGSADTIKKLNKELDLATKLVTK